MKLRKKQIKVRKDFSFPRRIFRNPSEEIFDFLESEVSGSSYVPTMGYTSPSNL